MEDRNCYGKLSTGKVRPEWESVVPVSGMKSNSSVTISSRQGVYRLLPRKEFMREAAATGYTIRVPSSTRKFKFMPYNSPQESLVYILPDVPVVALCLSNYPIRFRFTLEHACSTIVTVVRPRLRSVQALRTRQITEQQQVLCTRSLNINYKVISAGYSKRNEVEVHRDRLTGDLSYVLDFESSLAAETEVGSNVLDLYVFGSVNPYNLMGTPLPDICNYPQPSRIIKEYNEKRVPCRAAKSEPAHHANMDKNTYLIR